MNFDLSEEQQMMRESFARFLDEESSMARVRAAWSTGFDAAMWKGLAELGAFSLRVPEAAGGLGLGLLDAAVLMEEVGRTLASGPVAETLVAARLLAAVAQPEARALLDKLLSGDAVVSIALHDIEQQPLQWVAGGAVADAVLARAQDQLLLLSLPAELRKAEENLAQTAIAELDLSRAPRRVLASGGEASRAFAQGLEEWKLLLAVALSGLSREALRLAAAYACERSAFGQLIGSYQGISHPLADLITDVDGGKLLALKTIRDIADAKAEAGAEVSLSIWWNTDTATRAVAQALHTFGGYGLTTEYDIHLYNLRAKAWPLVYGDPAHLLEEAGRRLFAGEQAELPEAGAVSIDFDLGEEAQALAHELHEFFNKTLTPELRAKAHYSFDGFDAGVHKKLAEARLLFPNWEVQYGGRKAPPYAMSAVAHVYEEQNWSSHAVSTTSMVGVMMQRFGSEQLKREVLSKVIAGEAICSLGYSEPSCGSDVFAAQTRATREADGSWRIDGSKMFTSGANIAEYVLMLTRTNPDVPKHKGLTMFIVPLKTPGVTIQPVYTFQDERTNITYYDGVKIPDAYRLGEVDGGVKVMASALELEHGGGFARAQKAMVLAAEKLCREVSWRGQPLIAQSFAQARLARATAHYFLSEVLGHRALWWGAQKKPNMGYGPMTKLFSSEKFLKDSADLLDLTAPHSLSKRVGAAGFLNQCYRHAQGSTIYGGTSEVHRSQIAERALNLPRTRA
ncbi:Acyl-CoA dehydrogenase [Solimonas aquatica]|uniref:Acyl-CoA dehydrogenase n=1 Tax=Solimonas aquatica TaxID=489703 RepID=A0A1H9MHN3_9GAMM|nr:acyl-CoA dehydrogenase [Solimonas aquatica]SER23029.1 Acyl-CoA dehydrogenase [Solimonas aquatica]